ncbi:MAG: AhpC/TSA family protein [Bacteroidaceae bacterium]|nr:AhpC/TSA family protein [Bacteroidaceae bacterium]
MKNLFFALLLLCSTLAMAQTEETIIKGKVKDIKKGRLHMLARTGEDRTDTICSCEVKKGKFVLKTTMAEPMLTRIVLEGYSGGFTLFAEPGEEYTALLSNDKSFYIKGGKLNEAYSTHIAVSDSLNAVISAQQQRYDSLRAGRKFRSASLVNDSLRRNRDHLRDFTQKFLAGNDNIILAYTICSNIEMRDMRLKESREMYASMSTGAKASQYGRIIKERIDRLEKTEGGAKAPDFTLEDVNGDPVTMSAVKGKIKIIDFWASWCGPCRMNNPALRKLYEEFHDKGLEIIGVSLDNKKANWQMAVDKDGLGWINISSLKGWKCEVAKAYNVTGIPALFVLDENNNIIATGLRGEQLRNFVQERLK